MNYAVRSGFLLIVLLMAACQNRHEISYSEEIKPLLNNKCLRCHGGIRAQGGFSLLFPEDALATNESGNPAIVPGRPASSEMIKRVKHSDPELKMPQEGLPLTEEEVKLLETWIYQGAKFDQHWAYRALEIPVPPKTTNESGWGNNDIDHYILEKMTRQQLQPNKEADPATLVRRISFDLTGLPPKLEEIEKLLSNYSRSSLNDYVDNLLASPHYGEHFTSMWLDLARYADSKGYEKDDNRSIWRYRDWVINALNADMPFDEFTIKQLAGDLFPQPDTEDLIATAFHRNTMTNTEGGTEDEEFRTTALIDRVNTTFEVWQGTTISCVQCHSHPYDPFKHEEFYQLLAVFNSTQDADLDSEYPFIIEVPDSLETEIHEIASWIKNLHSSYDTIQKMVSHDYIRELVYPRLFGDFADDFQDVLIHANGMFSNSAYNANNQKHKKYYLVYNDVNLDKIDAIKYEYSCHGDDARIDVYLDQLQGTPIVSSQMIAPAGEDDWTQITTELPEVSGQHDLIFHFVNTTGDFRNGVVTLKEIELVNEQEPISKKLRMYQDSLLKVYRSGIRTPVMKKRSEILNRQSYVFERGNYLVKGDTVEPGIPHILNRDSLKVSTRMDLARWLVSDANPLTARVIVNRIWSHIFGEGLVSTLEDFGTQGEPPSHPELLDYLAYQFSHSWNWSIKTLVREIVSSATYQQSSDMIPAKIDKDPLNVWYSRANRFRLSAEQIRDQALVISDLLNPEVGGKSVMPPQPEGVWQVIYSLAKWRAENPEDKYRRGLYTFWKRTTPYPSMTAFDTPSREFCVSRRIRTNTPLQALVTLNDTVYLETAHALGDFMKREGQGNLMKAIKAGYKKALFKDPDEESLVVLRDLYKQATLPRAKLISNENKDPKVLDPYTVLANTILNLDAVLTKS